MNTILVAVDESWAIGYKGNIPWHNSEDLKLFKKTTTGHTIIMGRKTWDSLPIRPLPNRDNYVVSKTIKGNKYFEVFPSLEEALLTYESRALGFKKEEECFIIGGAKLYEYALANNLVDRILLSRIPGSHEADAYFPALGKEWLGVKIKQYDTFSLWEFKK